MGRNPGDMLGWEGRVRLLWGLRGLRRWVQRQLLPPVCPSCQRASGFPGRLCPACEEGLERIHPGHACPRCSGPGPVCPDCKRFRGGLRAIHACYLYRGSGGRCVRALKLQRDLGALGFLGRAMARRLGREDPRYRRALLVPVPLSRRRRKERGFNQAEALAGFLAQRLGIPLHPGALERVRETLPQGSPLVTSREKNLEGAFALGWRARFLRGAEVCLVDDVVTSGATLRACARVLRLEGGASSVTAFVACSARRGRR